MDKEFVKKLIKEYLKQNSRAFKDGKYFVYSYISSRLRDVKPEHIDEIVEDIIAFILMEFGDNNVIFDNLSEIEYFSKNIKKKKECTIDEYMEKSLEYINAECKDQYDKVTGDCGDPSFKGSKKSNFKEQSSKLIPLFNKLYEIDNDKICVVIKTGGEGGEVNADFKSKCKDKAVIQLDFLPSELGRIIIEEATEKLGKLKESPSDEVLKINGYFPLNYSDEESKRLLDLIIEKSKTIQTCLVNNMCNTCFPAFYYLINKSDKRIVYQSSPAQGYGSNAIKTCTDFK